MDAHQTNQPRSGDGRKKMTDGKVETPGKFSYAQRWLLNSGCLLLSDSLVLALALVLAGMARFLLKDSHIPPSRGFYIIPAWWCGAVLLRLAPSWGMGEVEKLRRSQLLLLSVFGLAAAALFLSKSADATSRLKFSLAYVLSVPMIPIVRSWMTSILVGLEKWGVPTVIYGSDQSVRQAFEIISHEPALGYIPCGYFEDEQDARNGVAHAWNIRRLGNMGEHTKEVPFALIGTRSIQSERLQMLLDGPLSVYRRVIILPDLLDIPSVWVMARDFNGVLGLELVRNLLNPAARLFKLAFDVSGLFGR